jgi:hypothetical protein
MQAAEKASWDLASDEYVLGSQLNNDDILLTFLPVIYFMSRTDHLAIFYSAAKGHRRR